MKNHFSFTKLVIFVLLINFFIIFLLFSISMFNTIFFQVFFIDRYIYVFHLKFTYTIKLFNKNKNLSIYNQPTIYLFIYNTKILFFTF